MRRAKSGLSARTARDARSTFANILGDAIPRHIQANPAARRRGKGRKGLRRIARIQTRERAWPTPLQALLFAERAAVLSGYATDFVMNLTIAYTGARWGEALGLPPECIRPGKLDLHWKLYELNGRFYRGRPKDGSMRTVDIPTFLDALLADHVNNPARRLTCDCRKRDDPEDDSRIDWCDSSSYVFLGPLGGHFRRSNYSERVVRPAADGWYPARKGKHARLRLPVLVDAAAPWPGLPLVPWPQAEPDTPFVPPRGRGRPAIHPDAAVASWLPILPGLVPHGLRHGHKTWMDEGKIARALSTDRMGHEVPGMEGVYGHITPAMRRELLQLLDALWVESLNQRRKLAPHSAVPLLDRLLTGGPTDG
jgi:integrase